jgi:hypothetical protein
LFVTGAAFAQFPDGLTIGSWGTARFVPVQGVFKDGEDPLFLTGIGSGWGPAFMGLNFRFSAADGRIGGGADIERDADGPSNGGQVNIWAKPFGSDILYLAVGKTIDERFRGPGTDGNFQGFIGSPGHDGDYIFNRFEPNAGALFVSQPITGLSFFAQLSTPGISFTGPVPLGSGVEAKDVYKSIQAGFAYDIPGIGLARAQWFGNTMDLGTPGKYVFDGSNWDGLTEQPKSGSKEWGTDVDGWIWTPSSTSISSLNPSEYSINAARIEAAFKLKAVENLNLDIGLKLPIPVKEEFFGVDVVAQDNFQINLAGDFTAGDFKVVFGLYTAFGGYYAVDLSVPPYDERSKKSATVDIIVVPSFYVAAIDATVGGDLGFKVTGASTKFGTSQKKDESTTFGLGAWISRGLGNGLIKTGLAFQLPKTSGDKGIQNQTSYLSWPIILEISFEPFFVRVRATLPKGARPFFIPARLHGPADLHTEP